MGRDYCGILQNMQDMFGPQLPQVLHNQGFPNGSLTVETTHPPPTVSAAPAHVPPNVAKPFIDGQDVFAMEKYEAAAFSVRQALERAIKHIAPSATGGLKARVKALGDEGRVAKDLVDLAHTVRAEGNVAVHEEEWTKEEAHQLIEFARLFFVYVFTLPAQVASVAAERGASADRR